MKKFTYLIWFLLGIHASIFSQPCLPNGLMIENQETIDNFDEYFPNCTEIEGYLYIGDSPESDISNLDGLSSIRSIGGNLSIFRNPNLTSLSGLDSLSYVGGYLTISGNESIINLKELELLTSINGDLSISGNPGLQDLSGLHNIKHVDGDLNIGGNDLISNLSGLDNLESILGAMKISYNDNLTDLEGLWNLSSADYIDIQGNNSLINCSGIGVLDTLRSLTIRENEALTSFVGFEGLAHVEVIVEILSNPSLDDLSGFESLQSVGKKLNVLYNERLKSLSGLENLTFLGEGLTINYNHELQELSALSSLDTIGGVIFIYNNNALTSLSGLDNIDASYLDQLSVYNNPKLSTCDVRSVCDFLTLQTGYVDIYGNAFGCHNQEAVEQACEASSIDDNFSNSNISIYPNPGQSDITISSKTGTTIDEVKIVDQMGQLLLHTNEQSAHVDVSNLQRGIYVVEVTTGNLKIRKKLIIK